MSRSFLTGLNLNKNELLNARIQNLASAPSSPAIGQIYYNTGDNTLRYWNGTSWLTLAQGGDLSSAISAAIDALTTDDIEEGSSNLYYTDGRSANAAANLLTSATLTNITITGDGTGLTITAENGGLQDLSGLDTDDLTEGTTNFYFTDERAQDAIGNAIAAGAQSGITVTYDDANGEIDFSVADQWSGKTTSDLTEGTNLYFTDERAQDAIGTAITNGTQSGITVTYVDADNEINFSVADQWSGKDTDDLTEGTSNLYFTTTRARDSVSAGDGLDYNASTGVFSADLKSAGGLTIDTGEIKVDRTTTDTWYDEAGAASTVAGDLTDHIEDTSTHGVTGDIVGTTDSQTLTNKVLGEGTALAEDLDADGFTIIGLPDPVNPEDAANKRYVDDRVSGLTWKSSADLLADSNIALTGTSGTLVIDGHDALDSGSNGYRILLTNQSTDTQNGIYVYSDAGSGYTLTRAEDADPYGELVNATIFIAEGALYGKTSWTQANGYITSFAGQDWVQFNGAQTYNAGAGLVLDGNTFNIGGTSGRIVANSDTIDLATTEVTAGSYGSSTAISTFTVDAYGRLTAAGTVAHADATTSAKGIASFSSSQFTVSSGAVSISALSGNVISSGTVATTYGGTGLNSFTANGAVYATSTSALTTGTLPLTAGGTGATTAAGARTNIGATAKYAANNTLLQPTANVVTWEVSHGLNTRDVTVQLFTLDTYEQVEVDVIRTNTATVTLSFVATANVAADSYRVVVVG
jgi:hypothetical protein